MPLNITDPSCGTLHFHLDVTSPMSSSNQADNNERDPVLTNVANAAAAAAPSASTPAASASSPSNLNLSPDSLVNKLPSLSKATLIPLPGSQGSGLLLRRKLQSGDHNKIMSLARTCRRLSTTAFEQSTSNNGGLEAASGLNLNGHQNVPEVERQHPLSAQTRRKGSNKVMSPYMKLSPDHDEDPATTNPNINGSEAAASSPRCSRSTTFPRKLSFIKTYASPANDSSVGSNLNQLQQPELKPQPAQLNPDNPASKSTTTTPDLRQRRLSNSNSLVIAPLTLASSATPSPKKRTGNSIQDQCLTLWQNGSHGDDEADQHQVVKRGRGSDYGLDQDHQDQPQPPPAQPQHAPKLGQIKQQHHGGGLVKLRPKKAANPAPLPSDVEVAEDLDVATDLPGSHAMTNAMKRASGEILRSHLHRQSAVSYEVPLRNQPSSESMDSTVSGAAAGPPRRPRSLTHQSVGSSHGGFSLFGSVDSEQSVPRTAPLATPEQDMSLLDISIASVDNLPHEGQHGQATRMESIDDVSNEVFQAGNDLIMDITDNAAPASTITDPQGDPGTAHGVDPPVIIRHHNHQNPISFSVEITPPAETCPQPQPEQEQPQPQQETTPTIQPPPPPMLPDVVPKNHQRLLRHRPSLTNQHSSSLDTDSSLADTPIFLNTPPGATAFPFSPIERHDSTTSSGSASGGADTPSGGEAAGLDSLRRLKKHHTRQGYPITPTPITNPDQAGQQSQQQQPSIRLPCLPERSTYPLELQEALPPSKTW